MGKKTKDKKQSVQPFVCFAAGILAACLWTGLCGYFLKLSVYSLAGWVLLSAFGGFFSVFSYYIGDKKATLFWWNRNRLGRYTILLILFQFSFTALFYLPFLTLPLSAVCVILTLFSNGFCGMAAYLFFLIEAAFISGLTLNQIIVLTLAGVAGAALFQSLDKQFRYGGVLFAYLIGDFACYSLYYVAGVTGMQLGDAILYTAIRLFALCILILVSLKLAAKFSIYRDDEFFMKINDPEHRLLSTLKQTDRDIYFHAVHTAYLSEKIARRIGANAALAKAGGYYHKIGVLQGEDTMQNAILIGKEYRFPDSLMKLLEEYGVRNPLTLSRETAIVQLADALVSSITFMFQKNKNADLNYEKIVDIIIKKKMDSGDWAVCELTMEDICQIKEGFAEERMYYDFLR
ncbi:MAG: hypothetical protein J1E61_01845 [Lachnospiraceae bacterium]|nr:hypothetical protein [Lachnospiraceae bacterium]